MLDLNHVWKRLAPVYDSAGNLKSGIADFKGKSLTDFRFLQFPQIITVGGSPDFNTLTQVGPLGQPFPGGAICIAIATSCTPAGQPINPWLRARERYELQLSYTTNEQLMTAFGQADAAMGGGQWTEFPGKELWLPPQQQIQAIVRNLTPETIRITIAYGCLVWRFAQ